MCGICGYIGRVPEGLLEAMTTAISHRGPDSEGFYRTDGVGLGHRRLSIIDIKGGQQPISNEDESITLIGNGEIYNHACLRKQLEQLGHQFRTGSDNEVMLHLYEQYGPEGVRRVNGMFAIAIYDNNKKQLVLFRDRLGIKPMYYSQLPNCFLFSSESKSILRYPDFDFSLNYSAIHDYLALRYVPGPGGMFAEIRKFPAASYGILDQTGKLSITRYWQPPVSDGHRKMSDADYLEGFAEHFERSISRRLMTEVPFGAYLSGGLDSSTIVAAMAERVSDPVRTFTVGFDYEHDELNVAADTAKRFGCKHTEIRCQLSDLSSLPDIIYHLDEPVGDPIIMPMYKLAQEAKKNVTVILAGEGADEILGGYLFHKALLKGQSIRKLLPGFLHHSLLAGAVSAMPSKLLNLAFDYPATLGNRGKQKIVDFLRLLAPEKLPLAWRHLISLFDERDTNNLYTDDFLYSLSQTAIQPLPTLASKDTPFLDQILHLQFAHWLPDDILTKQDKLSMAHGIEARVPFLDHELVEFCMTIPQHLKIGNGVSKRLLRQYSQRHLPSELTQRRKLPFYAPVEKWCNEPGFKELVNDTLSDKTTLERGLFQPQAINALKDKLHKGEFMYVKQVFSMVILELWLRMAVDRHALQ